MTDVGDDIRRLIILLGAVDCSKSFVIDAALTILTEQYGWMDRNYAVFATTQKAATVINGSSIHSH